MGTGPKWRRARIDITPNDLRDAVRDWLEKRLDAKLWDSLVPMPTLNVEVMFQEPVMDCGHHVSKWERLPHAHHGEGRCLACVGR